MRQYSLIKRSSLFNFQQQEEPLLFVIQGNIIFQDDLSIILVRKLHKSFIYPWNKWNISFYLRNNIISKSHLLFLCSILINFILS